MTTNELLYYQPQKASPHSLAGLVLIAWFALIVALIAAGAFETLPGKAPLALILSLLTPISLFLLAYVLSENVRSYVLNLDQRLLILLHGWRTLGLGFIMLYSLDQLPWLFALPAGLGDALTALAAVFLGVALFKQPERVSRQWIRRWNLFGFTDFIVAVSLGLITRTGMPGYSDSGPSSDLMSAFPFVLVPGFIVPLFAITHVVIYLQLRQETRA